MKSNWAMQLRELFLVAFGLVLLAVVGWIGGSEGEGWGQVVWAGLW